jgi:hypothetical protein
LLDSDSFLPFDSVVALTVIRVVARLPDASFQTGLIVKVLVLIRKKYWTSCLVVASDYHQPALGFCCHPTDRPIHHLIFPTFRFLHSVVVARTVIAVAVESRLSSIRIALEAVGEGL